MEYTYIPEKKLENHPKSVSEEELKIILRQIEKNIICKIKSNEEKEHWGTGFFAKIPFPDSLNNLPVLMTNHHIIKDNVKNKYEIFFPKKKDNNKTLKLCFDDSRYFYTNEEYDITIIEIKRNDGLDVESFFEIDNLKDIPMEDYKQKSIYLLQYPNNVNVDFSIGVIKNIGLDNYTIEHLCDTREGSSGSPILNVSNKKVIGIHKGAMNNINCNLGTLLKLPIEDFNVKMRKKSLNEIFEEIRDKKLDILYEIKSKKELLYLFIITNNIIFHKKYFGEIFYLFLKDNENLIKEYIEKNTKYVELYQYFYNMNLEQEEKLKNDLFDKIKSDINNNTDKLYNIIASFYFLIMYKFKDSKQFREYSNIGNAYLNVILQNFIIFLDKKFNYQDKNLFELLRGLYSLDINNLINQEFYNLENKTYSFLDIDKILLNDRKVNEYYEFVKMKYKKEYDDTLLTSVVKFLKSKYREVVLIDFEKNIKLIAFNPYVCSNTITILINGFLYENIEPIDPKNKWQDFINFFNFETMFYYFGWYEYSLKNREELKNESKSIIDAKNKAKICGKILAYILLSSKFFKDFQINLVGYGLGSVVVKHCIKELAKLNRIEKNNFVNLKNIIFIAGATHIENKNKWKEYIEEIIVNKFINCYSENDDILKNLYRKCSNEKAIGNEKLVINNDKGSNLVSNFDFTRDKFDHFSYKLRIVAEKIFRPYKDI